MNARRLSATDTGTAGLGNKPALLKMVPRGPRQSRSKRAHLD